MDVIIRNFILVLQILPLNFSDGNYTANPAVI